MVGTPPTSKGGRQGSKWTVRAEGIKVPKVEAVQSSQAIGGSGVNRIVVGVDIAKRVLQLHWVEAETGEIGALQLKRERFLEHFANRWNCLIGRQACGGSQHWGRSLQKLGHAVKLLSGRMDKPFVGGGNKNEAADARAICTAIQQPGIKAVALKSEEQQAVWALHRMLVKLRTAQINGLRGLLSAHAAAPRRSCGAEAQQITARVVERIGVASAQECGRRGDGEQDGTHDLGADSPRTRVSIWAREPSRARAEITMN